MKQTGIGEAPSFLSLFHRKRSIMLLTPLLIILSCLSSTHASKLNRSKNDVESTGPSIETRLRTRPKSNVLGFASKWKEDIAALFISPQESHKQVSAICSTSTGIYCPQGQSCSSGSCIPCIAGGFCPGNNGRSSCSEGFISDTGAISCSPCPPGKSSSSGATVCTNCAANKFCPGGQAAVSCAGGTSTNGVTSATNSSSCHACGPGYGSSTGGTCSGCTAGSYCTGASPSTTCVVSTFSAAPNNAAVTSCQKCEAGYSNSNAGSTTCTTPCAVGSFCVTGGAIATCPAATTTLTTGASAFGSCAVKCSAGEYLSSGNCLPCTAGKYCPFGQAAYNCPSGRYSQALATNITACTACTPGKKAADGGVCNACVAGAYCPEGVQIACPQGRYTISGTSQTSASVCLACPAGKYTNSAAKQSCDAVPVGMFSPAGGISLYGCPAGPSHGTLSDATDATTCKACAPGKYTSSAASSCSSCDNGYYCPGGNFQYRCPYGTSSQTVEATNPSVCSGCAPGFMVPDATSGCIPCGVNAYCPGGANYAYSASLACPNGFVSLAIGASSPATCTACAAGTYSSSSAACQLCTAGSYCPAASNQVSCPAGTANPALSSTSAASCVACGAGFYSSAKASTCLFCPFGSYCPGGSAAVACPAGTYATATEATNATVCAVCPPGKSSTAGSAVCTNCPLGYYCPGGSAVLACPAGTFSTTGLQRDISTCLACPPGRYSAAGSVFCAACIPGSYCPGLTSAIGCPAGKYNLESFATSLESCQSCPSGSYSEIGAIGCSQCTPGYYCPGARGRQPCPQGTYNPLSNSTSSEMCVVCGPGKYPNSNPGIFCNTCPPGNYCPLNGLYAYPCPNGFYSTVVAANSSDVCQPCPVGKYSDVSSGAAMTVCVTCSAGQYCPGAVTAVSCGKGYFSTVAGATTSSDCQACPAGFYSELNALGCTQCPGGAYCPGASDRVTCDVGKYNPDTGSNSTAACLQCAPGTYSAAGAVFCSPCPSGYYCPGNSDKILCTEGTISTAVGQSSSATCNTVCGAGFFSLPGGTHCAPCRPGSYCPTGATVLCAVGKYAVVTGAMNESACSFCAAGTYAPTTGTVMCAPCTIGAFANSTGSSTCICLSGYYCPDRYTQIVCPPGTSSGPGATACYAPTNSPTALPSETPSASPSQIPTIEPTSIPTLMPTFLPSEEPSTMPSIEPSKVPSALPSATPSETLSTSPTELPSYVPSVAPSEMPSQAPSETPSVTPSEIPSEEPTVAPSVEPSAAPSNMPSPAPSEMPSEIPSAAPSEVPSPTPSVLPSVTPSEAPSDMPSPAPSATPSVTPSKAPSDMPSPAPSTTPSVAPSEEPSEEPSPAPSATPSVAPSEVSSEMPSPAPSATPSVAPSEEPSEEPSSFLSEIPSMMPSIYPSQISTPPIGPTRRPTRMPTAKPSVKPTSSPSIAPVNIAFQATIYLKNVTAPVLDQAAQNAVCGAVAQTVGVANGNCAFEGQSAVRRRLVALPSYQIMAQVRVTASTGDFEDTMENTNGDALYTKLVTLLETAVETKAFTQTVRDKSLEFSAATVQYVGEVNFTATEYTVVVANEESKDDVSRGEYAGIIISAVFIVLVSVLAVWWCVCVNDSTAAPHNSGKGPSNIAARQTVETTTVDHANTVSIEAI